MKVAVFFIGRKRPGFDPQWGMFLEQAIRTQFQSSRFNTLFFGPIAEEAVLKNALTAARQSGAEVLIVSQPTMGDGNLWPVLLTEWNAPVILWATPENPQNLKVSACGLVGIHNWASGMSQAGCPPLLVYGLPGQAETISELNEAICVAATAKKLQHARIGLIGDHAPGFLNMAVDAAAQQRLLGPRLKRIGLYEFNALVRSFSEADVAADRNMAESLTLPIRSGVNLSDEVWDISSRYYLAVKQVAAEERFDAVALRCWPELPNEFGVWPYLAVSRLASGGINICEEGDVDGAVGCLIAQSLGSQVPAFNSDWLEHDDDSILLWHAGATPLEMCEPPGTPDGPVLDVHFNTQKPLVINAVLKIGMPVTLFRLWHFRDHYRLVVCEGTVKKPKRTIEGCTGLVGMAGGGVNRFFKQVCLKGMPHHVTVVQGHWASALRTLAEHYQPQPIAVVQTLGLSQSQHTEK
ncbi:MAG: L-fucose/L-arabinose isomerase family protein [Planctomycetaceae bacterium]|jgi:L-fucose isomerase-like protein|nr:L-fucose/L-arabinose isomerase family protein [Planctomycetaceae bacterium]